VEKLLYTVEEAAELLSVSRCKVYELISDELLYSVKVGRSRRVPAVALARFVETLSGAAA